MRVKTFFLVIFIGFSPSYSVGREIVCDGSVTMYFKEFASQVVSNILFRVEGDSLTLQSSLPGFFEEFKDVRLEMTRAQSLVTLTFRENGLFTGGINRHTGEIFLLLRADEPVSQLRSTFSGICEQRELVTVPTHR